MCYFFLTHMRFHKGICYLLRLLLYLVYFSSYESGHGLKSVITDKARSFIDN